MNDPSKAGVWLKDKPIVGCWSHRGAVCPCSLMSPVPSDVSLCQVRVFWQIVPRYRNVTRVRMSSAGKQALAGAPRKRHRTVRRQCAVLCRSERRPGHVPALSTEQGSASPPRSPLSQRQATGALCGAGKRQKLLERGARDETPEGSPGAYATPAKAQWPPGSRLRLPPAAARLPATATVFSCIIPSFLGCPPSPSAALPPAGLQEASP